MSAELIPLAPEDRAILALESETVVGHTCKIVRLGPIHPGRDPSGGGALGGGGSTPAGDPGLGAPGAGAPGVEELRARVAERIRLTPPLTRRLAGTREAPGWQDDPSFDLRAHVTAAPVAGPVSLDGLRELVAELFAQRLPRERPLWRMDVVALDDGDSAIVWRIHHALADGAASVRYARALLWDDAPEPRASAHELARAHAREQARRTGHLAGFLEREFAGRRSPFDGTIGTRREIGLTTVSLPQLRAAGKTIAGATVNDAVLAVLTGGLRDWIHDHHGHLGAVRVRVPVSLHHEGEDAANRDSYFSLSLPLSEPDVAVRLRTIHRRALARKRAGDAEEMEALMHELAGVSPRLRRFCQRVQGSPREFALCVSNVPGPRAPVCVLGAPVRTLHSIAEIGARHALRVSVISLAGGLCFGFCADPALIDGVQGMADAVHAQARALIDSIQTV
jgi:diacylglycerol O-acyltransferase / wax synthase